MTNNQHLLIGNSIFDTELFQVLLFPIDPSLLTFWTFPFFWINSLQNFLNTFNFFVRFPSIDHFLLQTIITSLIDCIQPPNPWIFKIFQKRKVNIRVFFLDLFSIHSTITVRPDDFSKIWVYCNFLVLFIWIIFKSNFVSIEGST